MKHMKKVFNTNGSITEDEDMGEIIQLQGDQRQNVKEWLLAQEVVTAQEADRIVIHGLCVGGGGGEWGVGVALIWWPLTVVATCCLPTLPQLAQLMGRCFGAGARHWRNWRRLRVPT